jgi:hypothetical protein
VEWLNFPFVALVLDETIAKVVDDLRTAVGQDAFWFEWNVFGSFKCPKTFNETVQWSVWVVLLVAHSRFDDLVSRTGP